MPHDLRFWKGKIINIKQYSESTPKLYKYQPDSPCLQWKSKTPIGKEKRIADRNRRSVSINYTGMDLQESDQKCSRSNKIQESRTKL